MKMSCQQRKKHLRKMHNKSLKGGCIVWDSWQPGSDCGKKGFLAANFMSSDCGKKAKYGRNQTRILIVI